MDPYNEVEICQFRSYLLKENGAKSGKLTGQNLICISGIFRSHFQVGELESKVPSLEAGNIPDLLPTSIICVFKKQGILGMKRQGQNSYTYRGEY